jgi:YGGT family
MTDIVTKKTTVTGGDSTGKTSTPKNSYAGGEKAEKSQTLGYVIYFLFGVLEVLLIFRLVFKLTGASPASSFVSLIYSLTQIFIVPFAGIFHQATTQGVETTAVLEPSTLVAIAVYAVIAWGISQLVGILSGRVN